MLTFKKEIYQSQLTASVSTVEGEQTELTKFYDALLRKALSSSGGLNVGQIDERSSNSPILSNFAKLLQSSGFLGTSDIDTRTKWHAEQCPADQQKIHSIYNDMGEFIRFSSYEPKHQIVNTAPASHEPQVLEVEHESTDPVVDQQTQQHSSQQLALAEGSVYISNNNFRGVQPHPKKNWDKFASLSGKFGSSSSMFGRINWIKGLADDAWDGARKQYKKLVPEKRKQKTLRSAPRSHSDR
jgi:hypothetical protein